MNRRVLRAVATCCALGVAGCASHHRVMAPVPPLNDVPELSQTPLYAPEMSENHPRLPNLPTATTALVVLPPPPPPDKPHRIKKSKSSSSVVAASPKPVTPSPTRTGQTDTSPASASPPAAVPPKPQENSAGPVSVGSDKAPAAQARNTSNSAASPIGELTAGSTAEAAQTGHQTADLLRTTRDGLDGIRRSLSDEEKKTATEIRTFLGRSEQALKNGDVDGAFNLATKAKLLLDELTGQ